MQLLSHIGQAAAARRPTRHILVYASLLHKEWLWIPFGLKAWALRRGIALCTTCSKAHRGDWIHPAARCQHCWQTAYHNRYTDRYKIPGGAAAPCRRAA